MAVKKDKRERPVQAGQLVAPRKRGESDTPATAPKKYVLPFSVLLSIRKVASEYGSQARALQVGSELLIRMRQPLPLLMEKEQMVRTTYKLVPRTIELIDKLSGTMYEDDAHVLAACVEALKIKKL